MEIYMSVFVAIVGTTAANASCQFQAYNYQRLTNQNVVESHVVSGGPRCKQLCKQRGATCWAANLVYRSGVGFLCELFGSVPQHLNPNLGNDRDAVLYLKSDDCPNFCSGRDCDCVIHHNFCGNIENGVYTEHDAQGNKWVIVLRRHDGSEDFEYKMWDEYKDGFGSRTAEFWLGLETLHQLTTNGSTYTVRFDMRSYQGECRYAEYSTFHVGPENDGYRLSIDGYSGTAGDAIGNTDHGGIVNIKNMQFTGRDKDNDLNLATNCALQYRGAWWANDCFFAKPTGVFGESFTYGEGILWEPWLGTETGPEYIDMKIMVN